MMISRAVRGSGFTLIELMVVLAILTILASMAVVFHQHALAKAQAVEAEVVLAEINRLESLYHTNHGAYAGDLKALGFTVNSLLKYYKVGIQLQQGGAAFQATALPLAGSAKQLAVVLTRSKDGQTTLQKVDPGTLALQAGGQSGYGRTSLGDPGTGGVMSGTGGKQSQESCREGGDATVAQDGLLDMNFCLR